VGSGDIQLLANTAGIVRGCLANLGIQASVVGESSNLPQGTSNVRLSIYPNFEGVCTDSFRSSCRTASFQIKILKPGGNA